MTLEERVVEALRRERLTVALAESLTGGLVAARLTKPPRASDAFLGGVVSYTDGAKAGLLGVDRRALRELGGVSALVARQMASGAREALGADIAVSLTGFAGPDVPPGGELGKVFIAVAHWGGVETHEVQFAGTREAIREACVERALEHILDAAARAVKARD